MWRRCFRSHGAVCGEGLEDGTRGNTTGRSWLRSSLVVVQVSLALVALVGALLFVRTFLNFAGFDFGYTRVRS